VGVGQARYEISETGGQVYIVMAPFLEDDYGRSEVMK